MNYTVEKHRGKWWVIDSEGYEARSIGWDYKYEALESARICEVDDVLEAKRKEQFINSVLGVKS